MNFYLLCLKKIIKLWDMEGRLEYQKQPIAFLRGREHVQGVRLSNSIKQLKFIKTVYNC
jgi:hypothetical protein